MRRPWRRCARCGEDQPIDQYAKNPHDHSKRRGICLTCEPPNKGYSDDTARKMCGNKRGHKTEGDALHAALAAAERSHRQIRAYLCPLCNHWHLTSKAKGTAA